MSPTVHLLDPAPATIKAIRRLRVTAGDLIRTTRRRRAWTIRRLADAAGVSKSAAHDAETGGPASLETILRCGLAVGLQPSQVLVDGRARPVPSSLEDDFVHGAMGESIAARMNGHGFPVAIDEPYQHYQFAGRADVLAWDLERRALLHVENRTRFPDLQDVAGSYNAKRAYLAASIGQRLGVSEWRSVTNCMAVLWSSEALRALRARPASFRALCPDPSDAFAAWWSGRPPEHGVRSTLVIVDPLVPADGRRRAFVGLDDVVRVEPRYRDYADAARALRRSR